MNTEELFEVPNAIFLLLPSEMRIIQNEIQESYRYLLGLSNIEPFYKGLLPTNDSKISDNIEKYKNELLEIDKEVSSNEDENGMSSFKDVNKLKSLIQRWYLLKENMDSFQVEILKEFIDIILSKVKEIITAKKYLEQNSLLIYSSFLLKLTFVNFSQQNTKRYFLLIDGENKLDKTINPFENYFNFEITDYSLVLSGYREIFKDTYERFLNLVSSVPEIDNKRNLDKLVKKQYSLDKQVLLLTYIIGFLTIVMTVLAVVQIAKI